MFWQVASADRPLSALIMVDQTVEELRCKVSEMEEQYRKEKVAWAQESVQLRETINQRSWELERFSTGKKEKADFFYAREEKPCRSSCTQTPHVTGSHLLNASIDPSMRSVVESHPCVADGDLKIMWHRRQCKAIKEDGLWQNVASFWEYHTDGPPVWAEGVWICSRFVSLEGLLRITDGPWLTDPPCSREL